MIGIICSTADPASMNMEKWLISHYALEENASGKAKSYCGNGLCVYEINGELINADFVDELGIDVAYFASRHSSAKGVSAFTTHPTGNWGSEAMLGGKPKALSVAAPLQMLGVLNELRKLSAQVEGMQVVYEATHHGPLLKTPSLFVELGGNFETVNNAGLAAIPANAIIRSMDSEPEFSKVAIGIGGTHYPSKFTELALKKGYAFAHMLPKYAMLNADGTDNFAMLESAVFQSAVKPEIAVIEWKSLNSKLREMALAELEKIGMDYERV
ncbi:MAG: D-aminoacyl-tRNA deacylase [Candidatus Micrarchaeaceae archaeon]